MSIFYPIDHDEYISYRQNTKRTSPYLLDGMNDVKGFASIYGISSFWFRDFMCYRLRAINDATMHTDFTDGGKQLTPVILSHGLKNTRTGYASIASYLASYGCIVYCMTHTDGSALYYEDMSSGRAVGKYYHNQDPLEHGANMLQTRIIDIQHVLDYVKRESQNDALTINMKKLVALGHSMGGITSIEMAHKFPDFKYCIAIDPWFYP